jgi:hypothetical protein
MTGHLTRSEDEQPQVAQLQVAIGTHVRLELHTASDESESLEVDIVPDRDADFSAGFLGAGTPLAQAIMSQLAGARVPYQAADVVEVSVLEVSASVDAPSADTASSRQAVIDRAVSRSNLTDTLRLALAVDVKWGDYDPEALEEGWEPSDSV